MVCFGFYAVERGNERRAKDHGEECDEGEEIEHGLHLVRGSGASAGGAAGAGTWGDGSSEGDEASGKGVSREGRGFQNGRPFRIGPVLGAIAESCLDGPSRLRKEAIKRATIYLAKRRDMTGELREIAGG